PAEAPRSRRPKDEEEKNWVDRMVVRTGYAEQHYAVEECMVEHQDWHRCWELVQSFQECMAAFQNVKKKQLLKTSVTAVTVFIVV
uniref:Uncharacterized protein n=1 Tax=Scleropages formosus TaxID=113540 RepID=A0A8C9R405_SCLFO